LLSWIAVPAFGSGHSPQIEEPAGFFEALRAFLTRVLGEAGQLGPGPR
jgi:hypothetical protein